MNSEGYAYIVLALMNGGSVDNRLADKRRILRPLEQIYRKLAESRARVKLAERCLIVLLNQQSKRKIDPRVGTTKRQQEKNPKQKRVYIDIILTRKTAINSNWRQNCLNLFSLLFQSFSSSLIMASLLYRLINPLPHYFCSCLHACSIINFCFFLMNSI